MGPILFVALIAVVATAFLNRLGCLAIEGGLVADQLAWAMQYYFGGLTSGYLAMRDAILSWTPEPQPWPYLPGYPAFLAILYGFGVKDLAFIRLVQIAIDSLAVLPLYYVLHRIGRSTLLALAGCLMYAVSPWWGAGSTFLLAEALLPALVISLLAALALVGDRASTAVGWFLLGVFSSILPFFRSEMVLLWVPLAIWALLVAPERRRSISAACVVAGFALPLVLWSARNYYIHDEFMLTPPAKWYAAWSGLGQVANDFGYAANDARAGQLLQSKGIKHLTRQAESFWFDEYIEAWIKHPRHVISTILFRFRNILGQPDPHALFVPRWLLTAYQAMAIIAPIAMIWLLCMRRWSDAFLTAFPMLYALGSLGPIYVEFRYVRYAGLSYLLVLPFLFGKSADLLVMVWPRRWRLLQPEDMKATIGALGLALVATGAVVQLVSVAKAAQVRVLDDRLDGRSIRPPTSTLDDIAFMPATPAVEVSRDAEGTHVQAHVPAGIYLLSAPMGASANGTAIISYRFTVQRGAVGLGVLSADSQRWLSHKVASAEPGVPIEGTLVSAVEAGSRLVIDAQGSDGTVSAVASSLEWTLLCPGPVELYNLLLDRSVRIGECPSGRRTELK